VAYENVYEVVQYLFISLLKKITKYNFYWENLREWEKYYRNPSCCDL